MKLLALVLLLSSFSSLALMEVVGSFKNFCPSFFIKDKQDIITPTVFTGRQYKKICQRWKNKYRFATVYDTERRIPVYSAYTFLQKVPTERSDEWKIEPQLDNIKVPEGKDVRDMMDSIDVTDVSKIKNQAVDSDYKDSGFTRGHVFPNSFGADQDQADSTFTLTNIAPQTQDSNGAWATQVEELMLKNITQKCRLDQNHQAYIVTGAVPGNNWTKEKENKRSINIPSHYWSAFCCSDKTDIKKLIGKAYLAELQNFTLRQPSIDKLNERLTELYGQEFRVFPGLTIVVAKNTEHGIIMNFFTSLINSFFEYIYKLSSRVTGEL